MRYGTKWIRTARWLAIVATLACLTPQTTVAAKRDPKVQSSVTRALDYLAREQRRQGYWEANGGQYRVAMTALSGIALLCEGSTTTRGRYAKNVNRAVDYLLQQAQPSGLIGFPDDFHYTYGHGFSMLFLSQVFGEEEDAERRTHIKNVLERAVRFCAEAQTSRGGWGYVSAKDGNDFDEGSTCITQVQGLRACRNAGIAVPREIIDRAKTYIEDCTTDEGGVQYSIPWWWGPSSDHRGRCRRHVQRRRLRVRQREENAGILPRECLAGQRHQPGTALRALALHALLLLAGDVPRREGLGQVL